MIFDFIQDKTNFSMSWNASIGETNIAKIEAPFIKGCFIADFTFSDGNERLIFDPNHSNFGSSLRERLKFRLYRDKEYLGAVYGDTQKGSKLFSSLALYRYETNSLNLTAYEVGFGKNGLFICFYKDDCLVAIAEKDLTVVNYKDTYKCYLADNSIYKDIIIMLVHYDVTAYGDMMEFSVYSKKKQFVNTLSKEQIAKYDPDFIATIKSRDLLK